MVKISNKKIKNFFTKKERKNFTEKGPENHWKLIFAFFGLILLVVAVFSFLLFWQIRLGEIFKAEEQQEVYFEELDQETLDKITDFFNEKERRLEELGFYELEAVVDPDLPDLDDEDSEEEEIDSF